MTLPDIFYLVGIIFFSVFSIAVIMIAVMIYRLQRFIQFSLFEVQKHVIALVNRNIGGMQVGITSMIFRKLGDFFVKRR